MKNFLLWSTILVLTSCTSIRVFTDHDSSVEFSDYKTFAYLKPEIDKVELSDLDKRRILKALDRVMKNKGYAKSETPDLLVSFDTRAKEKVYVNNMGGNWGWSPWFWNPWWGFGPNYNSNVSTQTEGILYINLIDAESKQLIWQGKGRGFIGEFTKNRDERINLFVEEILTYYPPEINE